MSINRRTVVIGIVGVLVAVVVYLTVAVLLGPALDRSFSCTLMGCFDVLDIEFEGFQPEAYTVEVSTRHGIVTQVFNCPSSSVSNNEFEPTGCSDTGVHIRDEYPNEITVKVTWEGGTKTETFQPSYRISQPNGPQCDPTCHIATVKMTLP